MVKEIDNPRCEAAQVTAYKCALARTAEKVLTLPLNKEERVQVVIATSHATFPQYADILIAQTSTSPHLYESSVKTVDKSPKLRGILSDILLEQTGDPGVIRYETSWEDRPSGKKGESDSRLLAILNEHLEKYPGIPVSLKAAARAMRVRKQMAWESWRNLEAAGKIPQGTEKLPGGYQKSRRKFETQKRQLPIAV